MRKLLSVLALGLTVAGCSVNLAHNPLAPVEHHKSGELLVAQTADGMSNRIGWGTFTALAIPVARVTVNGKADEALMQEIKSGLEHLGYSVRVVADAAQAGDLPVLTCQVNRFRFKNYTWFFPLVFNWGKIDVSMSLASNGEQPVWQSQIVGKASGFYSFEKTVNKALTKVLDQMNQQLAAR
jgi:hypothetical protein